MERTSHKKPKMPNIDLSRPLDMNIIGSEQDPCFGKHHSLTASECRVCGDNEICSIITGQLVNSEKRAKVHREHKFKDLEEAELLVKQSEGINKTLKFLFNKYPKGFQLSKAYPMVAKKFDMGIDNIILLVKSHVARNEELYTYDKKTKTITKNE